MTAVGMRASFSPFKVELVQSHLESAMVRDIEDALYRAVVGAEPINRQQLMKVVGNISRWAEGRYGVAAKVEAVLSEKQHKITLRVRVPDLPASGRSPLSAVTPFYPL